MKTFLTCLLLSSTSWGTDELKLDGPEQSEVRFEKPNQLESNSPRAKIDRRLQYLWQPLKGKSALLLSTFESGASFQSLQKVAGKNFEYDVRLSHASFSGQFSFGLTENWALGLPFVQYEDVRNAYTFSGDSSLASNAYTLHSSGYLDPSVTLAHQSLDGDWGLFYGCTLILNATTKRQTTKTQEGNRSQGGTSLAPYIAVTTTLSSQHIFGVRMTYTDFLQRTEELESGDDPNQAKLTTSGNSSVYNIFYEYRARSHFARLVLTKTYTDASKSMQSNVSTSEVMETPNPPSQSQAATFTYGIYNGPWQVVWAGLTASLTPATSTTSEYTVFSLALNYRWEIF